MNDNSKKTILLVEDEALIAMSEAALLDRYGYNVVVAHTAQDAVERAKNQKIDLILMDIDLGPGKIDGTTAAEAILDDHDVPIVFLSSHTEPEIVARTEKTTAYGFVVKNSGETVLLNSIKMAFKLFATQQQSQRNERMLITALDNSPAAIAIADAPDGRIKYANSASLSRIGDRKKMINELDMDHYVSAWNIRDVDGRPLRTEEVPLVRALRYGETNSGEFIIGQDDREDRVVIANAAPIFDANGTVESAIVLFVDITEHRQAADELHHKNELLKRTERIANIGGWEWDIATDTVTWSEELYHITGLDPTKPPPQFNAHHRSIYTDEGWKKLTSAVDHARETGESYQLFAQIVRGDAEIRDVHIYGGAKKANDGSVVGLFGIVQDITQRKLREKDLMQALQEKEYLMQEINHRVKNNLNMVASLIRLKSSETEADLSDVQHRIEAIGLIHEKLYQTKSASEISIREYLRSLVSSIFSSFTSGPVRLKFHIDDFLVSAKSAMPLGLIINEIATNAIKHGFSDTEEPVFSIRIEQDEENRRYEVTASNSGKPFPEDIHLDNPQSLGLQLISALTAQLGGTLHLQRAPHPVYTIRFPFDGE